jgi:penicillin amidase
MHTAHEPADGSASSLPPSSGRIRVPGLDREASVYRDRWSIPHIRAATSGDAFFALGYVHAQDRLWQMDAARMRMLGRWSEWVGPGGVAADTLARRLDVAGASRRDLDAVEPATRTMLERYAAGVNAWIAEPRALPLEYRLLQARPEPWLPWHSIAVMRQRGFLMGSVWFKLWRAAALRTIGPDDIAALRYDDGGGDLLCIPPGGEARRWIATLQSLAPAIEAVARLSGGDATGGGSNNWAVAASRTATGRPLLAGDPHRAFEMPNLYAQAHLACDAFDAIGLTVPGVPGFPHFAHNGAVAWCVTHAFADIHDLFVERFAPDDPARYAFRDGWRDATVRSETIRVRGGADVSVPIVTTHHGPVIAGDPAAGAALVLRSVQFSETDRSFDCLQPMLRARTVEGLFDATRGWGLIDHNLVAADVRGRIGHLVRATVPRRPRINGWLPVPGWTGEHEWSGMIPWERMPRVFDPPRGFLVTANNRIVADDAGDDYLCTDCHPPYRARRIETRLAALSPAATDLAAMQALHRDDLSLTAPIFQARLAALALGAQAPGLAVVRDRIVGWDARMSPDSVGATAYADFRWQLARVLVERSGLGDAAADPLSAVPPGVVPLNQLWWTLPSLLRADDAALLRGIGWDEACLEALRRCAAGPDPGPWGERHRPKLAHPLAALFPDAAMRLEPATEPIGGDNDTVWANGCYAATGLAASYGAVARYVFDVGAWQNSRWVVFHGVSGQPDSPHYMDQHAAWARCETVPMLADWPTIVTGSEPLVLEPAASR